MKTWASVSEQKISPSQSRIKSAMEIIALMSLLEREKKKKKVLMILSFKCYFSPVCITI